MNERIKKLADEAKMSTYLLAYGVEFNISIEKFAELIVRECMACSTWVGKVNENVKEPGPIHTAHAINQRIKKHFGVEE